MDLANYRTNGHQCEIIRALFAIANEIHIYNEIEIAKKISETPDDFYLAVKDLE